MPCTKQGQITTRLAETATETGFKLGASKRSADYRMQLIKMMAQAEYDWCVTIALNAQHPHGGTLRYVTAKLLQRLDRELVGRRYLKHPENRICGVFFEEKAETNPHVHGFLSVPSLVQKSETEGARLPIRFQNKLKEVWSNGSVVVKRCDDVDGWSNYITKEFWRRDFSETYFFAEDFYGRG